MRTQVRTHVRIVRTHSVRTVRIVRTQSTHTERIVRILRTDVRTFFVLTNFKKMVLQKRVLVKIQGFFRKTLKKTNSFLLGRGLGLGRVNS